VSGPGKPGALVATRLGGFGHEAVDRARVPGLACRQEHVQTDHGRAIVGHLGAHHQQVGFAMLGLHRARGLIEWMRQAPVPGGNVVDEALALAAAAASHAPFDVQRVYELVGTSTGDGVAMVFKDAEAKIVGRMVDLVLRAIARPDQAAHSAGRVADMMLELHGFHFADPHGAVAAEAAHLGRIAQIVAATGHGPVGVHLLAHAPEYPRGPLAPHAAARVGKPYAESFGPAAQAWQGPDWRDPYDDSQLEDGRDTRTSRKGHVEGW
jgi:hypothetical protein